MPSVLYICVANSGKPAPNLRREAEKHEPANEGGHTSDAAGEWPHRDRMTVLILSAEAAFCKREHVQLRSMMAMMSMRADPEVAVNLEKQSQESASN